MSVSSFPQKRRPQPFEVIYPPNLIGHDPEPVRWLVENCIPRGTVVLLTGDGGLGKSLLMRQLQLCTALGIPWLGHQTVRCRSYGFYCEDPKNILHWRQQSLCKHFGISELDLDDMCWSSRVGMDNSLMDFNMRGNNGHVTPTYDQMATHTEDFGSDITIVDTAAHTFNGNENNRSHVTSFIAALHRLAGTDGAVILCAHPSVSSMASGSGYSGNTAWKASTRVHMYLKRPKGYDDEQEDADHDARVLKTMKSNWGPGSGSTRVRWRDGAFVTDEPDRVYHGVSVVGRLTVDAAVMDAIRYAIGNGDKIHSGRQTTHNVYAVIGKMPGCKKYMAGEIYAAVDRLLKIGRLQRVEMGPKSNIKLMIRPSDMLYPGERPPQPPKQDSLI